MFDLNAVQVDDRIAYNTSRNYIMISFDEVAKVTKTTMTTKAGRRFNKHGEELKSERTRYPIARIWDVENAERYVENMEKRKEHESAIKELQKALYNKRELTDEQLEAVRQLTAQLNG